MEIDTMFPSINFELTPLPFPVSENAVYLWKQIPAALKEHGFGYYMSQHDDDYTMSDNEIYWSYAANYYYFNHDKEHVSFTGWQETVKAKVGGYNAGITPDQAATIIEQVETEIISFAEGAKQLFSRHQLNYFGW